MSVQELWSTVPFLLCLSVLRGIRGHSMCWCILSAIISVYQDIELPDTADATAFAESEGTQAHCNTLHMGIAARLRGLILVFRAALSRICLLSSRVLVDGRRSSPMAPLQGYRLQVQVLSSLGHGSRSGMLVSATSFSVLQKGLRVSENLTSQCLSFLA